MNASISSFLILLIATLVLASSASSFATATDILEAEINNILTKREKTNKKISQQQQQQQQPQSWKRWGVDMMKSVSGALEELSNSADELMMITTKDPISGETRHSDPVSSFAAALTNIVGGSRQAAAQARSGMSAEEKQRAQKQPSRRRSQTKSKSSTGNSKDASMMMELEDETEGDESKITTEGIKRWYGIKKATFSERVIADQKDLHERLFRSTYYNSKELVGSDDDNADQQQSVVSGNAASLLLASSRAKKNSRSAQVQQQHAHTLKSLVKGKFVAAARHEPTDASEVPTTNKIVNSRYAESLSTGVDSDLAAARSSFNSFCQNGGVTSVPFSPSMNFTCFDPSNPTTSSKFTINGTEYASPSFSNFARSACFPEDTFLAKYCTCPFDRVLYRQTDVGIYYCFGYNYDCNMTVVDPVSFTEKKRDVIVNSLARGIPLRLPYVGTIDRRSSSPVTISANIKCAPIPIDPAASSGSSFAYVAPSQAAPLNTTLVTANLPVSSLTSTSSTTRVTGTYTELRGSVFQYYYNLTNANASTLAAQNSNINANSVDAERFLITPVNYLFNRGLIYLRPYSFLDFSNLAGATTTTIPDEMGNSSTNALSTGLLVGTQNIALTFVPSQLSDDFFVGSQLSVEFGYMLPATGLSPSSNIQKSNIFLSEVYQDKNTPLSELITFDVTNAPAPLPPAPPVPLSTSTIVLICIGVAAVVAGIIAIIVAFYRRQKTKEAKIQRKQERREMVEMVRKEEELKRKEKTE